MKAPPSARYTSAQLSSTWNIPSRTLRDILQRAGVESQGGYDKDEAAEAVITHFRTVLSNFDVEAAKDRARKSKAEADSAEVDAAIKKGGVRRFFERTIADIAIRVRSIVESAEFLNKEQRQKLAKEFASMELPKSPI